VRRIVVFSLFVLVFALSFAVFPSDALAQQCDDWTFDHTKDPCETDPSTGKIVCRYGEGCQDPDTGKAGCTRYSWCEGINACGHDSCEGDLACAPSTACGASTAQLPRECLQNGTKQACQTRQVTSNECQGWGTCDQCNGSWDEVSGRRCTRYEQRNVCRDTGDCWQTQRCADSVSYWGCDRECAISWGGRCWAYKSSCGWKSWCRRYENVTQCRQICGTTSVCVASEPYTQRVCRGGFSKVSCCNGGYKTVTTTQNYNCVSQQYCAVQGPPIDYKITSSSAPVQFTPPASNPVPETTVTGFVWEDTNQNGTKDADEACYSGSVRVRGGGKSVDLNSNSSCPTYALRVPVNQTHEVFIEAPEGRVVTSWRGKDGDGNEISGTSSRARVDL